MLDGANLVSLWRESILRSGSSAWEEAFYLGIIRDAAPFVRYLRNVQEIA